MYTNKKTLFRIALPTLLGLTLTGTGLLAARADKDDMSGKGAKSDKSMRSDKHQKMDDDDRMEDNEMEVDPSPMGYPHAAPGSLHLYHWTDYTKTEMKEGSVADTRRDEMHEMAIRMHRREAAMTDDEKMEAEKMADPAPMGYPHAAPGSVHLYHWKDYTRSQMMSGSAPEMRNEQMREMDKKRHDRDGKMTDDEKMEAKMMADPASLGYPHAAPGSLHLYHWTDYTRTAMKEGSAAEERREQMRHADKKMHDNDKEK